MTTDLRIAISNRVSNLQGCKLTELVADFELVKLAKNAGVELATEVCNMCDENELVCIEYILPNMTYRIKTYVFPKGTKFTAETLAQFFDII